MNFRNSRPKVIWSSPEEPEVDIRDLTTRSMFSLAVDDPNLQPVGEFFNEWGKRIKKLPPQVTLVFTFCKHPAHARQTVIGAATRASRCHMVPAHSAHVRRSETSC